MVWLWCLLQVQYWLTFSFHTTKKIKLMDVLIGLIDLIEGTWMIFLYYMFGYILIFLNHLNLPTRFENILFLNISTQTSALNTNILALSFLNVRICCEKGTFVISVYRKLIFSEVFTNYGSFNPTYQKRQVKTPRGVL